VGRARRCPIGGKIWPWTAVDICFIPGLIEYLFSMNDYSSVAAYLCLSGAGACHVCIHRVVGSTYLPRDFFQKDREQIIG
jgi:hypothetical protein